MLNNVGIKVLNEEHGKKVIEWFQSQGVNTRLCEGSIVGDIYGVFNGNFDSYGEESVKRNFPQVKIITLPEELPKDWYIQITKENREELEVWRKSVATEYVNRKSFLGEFIVSKHYKDGSFIYGNTREEKLLKDHPGYVKIDLETFRKITKTMKQEPQMPDFTIKRTELPFIPKKTNYRVVSWNLSSKDTTINCALLNLVSYGKKIFNGEVYILAEKSEYHGSYHYMFKQSDVERLWKEQNSQTQIQKEMKPRIITAEQAQSIIDIACTTWKPQLAHKWANNIVLKTDIEISEEFYQEMRKACTSVQHHLFDKIFGVDDGSVDLSHLNSEQVRVATDHLIDVRDSGEFENKAFWLNADHNWEIKKDKTGLLCLIPTKKK